MNFSGFMKLTLLDFPGKVACTLFTAGCNFRCPFCHNASLVTHIENNEKYPDGEILSFLQKRQGILEGVCITGGEPLLHPELPEFIKQVKEMGYKVKLDTNGFFPEKLKELVEAQLVDYVAMDIKNSKEKYGLTVGIDEFDIGNIEKSVDFLLKGPVEYEFRTTIVRELHTCDDIDSIGKWLRGTQNYFLQSFVDSGDTIECGLSAHTPETMNEMRAIAQQYALNVGVRGI